MKHNRILTSVLSLATVLGLGAFNAAVGQAPGTNPNDDYSNFRNPSTPSNYGNGSSRAAPYDQESVATAYARAAAAYEAVRRWDSAVNVLPIQLQKQFESSPEWKAAQTELRDSYNAYVAAREPVLRRVTESQEYRSIQESHDRITKILAAGNLTPDDRINLATQKMQFGTQLRAMEASAFNNDAGVQQARTRMLNANQRVVALREGFDQNVRNNPEFASARRALGDARVQSAAASYYLYGLLAARQDALDAYYGQIYNDYRHNYPYSYYTPAYTYGYGTYYGR